MDTPLTTAHPQHRYLRVPPWADGSPPAAARDLLALDRLGALPSPSEPARAAAAAADPFDLPDPTARTLRAAVAAARAVPEACVFPATGLRAATAAVLGTWLRPGDRVVVSLPDVPAALPLVLADGAAYVDVGRDASFAIRHDALERVLDDQDVRAVLLGAPPCPAGPHPARALLETLAARPSLLVVDASAAPAGDLTWLVAHPDAFVLETAALWGGLGGLGAAWVLAHPDRVRDLWRLHPEAAVSRAAEAASAATLADPAAVAARLAALASSRAALTAALTAIPGVAVAASEGPSLLVRRPGVDAAPLAAALADAGVAVAVDPHPAAREGVRVTVPPSPLVPRVAEAFRRALATLPVVLSLLLALPACGRPEAPAPPPSAAPAAPSPAAPPAPETPPPGVTKRLHEPPLVGGCGKACATPADALTGFLVALAAPAPETRVPLFLDTSSLTLDGTPVGDSLAELWLHGRLDERRAEVDALARDLRATAGAPTEGPLVETANRTTLDQQPTRATASVTLPSGARWTVVLHRRGLEWLVVGVDRRP